MTLHTKMLGVQAFKAVLLAGLTAFTFATTGLAKDESEPAGEAPAAAVRRLSADQYQQVIRDVFGNGIKIEGRFEPDIRTDGLLALGAQKISVTATGFEWYDSMARQIAEQVVSPEFRGTLLPCKPMNEKGGDAACARTILGGSGQLLFRRPLTSAELDRVAGHATAAGDKLKDFYAGLQLGLTTLLESPEFLFRKDVVEPDPKAAGEYRLNAYSKASRLSFLLWNSAPDGELLRAAASGELHTEKGLAKQVDRMVASPRLERAVRAFFSDMLLLEDFSKLEKDTALYPKFISQVAGDSHEQLLRTIVDHLLTRNGDYRDLFTTRRTFLTPLLAANYRVPVPEITPNGALAGWVPFEFPEGDPRAGVLSQAGFAALHSHPGRTSPTLRGKALREAILCQRVPDPPGNVNFTVVQDTTNPTYKTARERLNAHATEAMCTGCHKITDPIGLALETFTTAGEYRTSENGAPIDTSGTIDGKSFSSTAEFYKVVREHPALTKCLVTRAFGYAVGHAPGKGEADIVAYLGKSFAEDGHSFPALLRRIATSKAMMRVAPQQTASAE